MFRPSGTHQQKSEIFKNSENEEFSFIIAYKIIENANIICADVNGTNITVIIKIMRLIFPI